VCPCFLWDPPRVTRAAFDVAVRRGGVGPTRPLRALADFFATVFLAVGRFSAGLRSAGLLSAGLLSAGLFSAGLLSAFFHALALLAVRFLALFFLAVLFTVCLLPGGRAAFAAARAGTMAKAAS
jgi:hypothetical protein